MRAGKVARSARPLCPKALGASLLGRYPTVPYQGHLLRRTLVSTSWNARYRGLILFLQSSTGRVQSDKGSSGPGQLRRQCRPGSPSRPDGCSWYRYNGEPFADRYRGKTRQTKPNGVSVSMLSDCHAERNRRSSRSVILSISVGDAAARWAGGGMVRRAARDMASSPAKRYRQGSALTRAMPCG